MEQLQLDLNRHIQARQKLETQRQENLLVQQEIAASSGQIYKLTGPVLMPVETDEAESHVDKRLNFITEEITSVDALIEKASKQMDALMQQHLKRQQQQQQQQLQQQQGPVANT